MKKTCLLVLFLVQLLTLNGLNVKIGLGVSSDNVFISLGANIFQGGFLSLEGGNSWEYQADMRIDDFKLRSVLRYTPPLFERFNPYLFTGLQYSYINTCYTTFWVPGLDIGLGILFEVGTVNEFFIELGYQCSTKKIVSKYSTSDYNIIYEETWTSPPFIIGAGWRIKLG